jgi:chitodextrinase
VDKAMAAEAGGLSGQVCIDETTNPPGYDYGLGSMEWELRQAANFAREVGFSVTEDQNNAEFGTAPAPLRCNNAALYSGWYSFNNYNNAFTWNTGAIGYHIDSASAVNPRGGSNWSANALLNGITATHGSVAEPYLAAFAHPDGVFNNLLQGANLGDAFLRNTVFLKWMMLNIGDPLYRPFPAGFPVITAPVNSLALNPQDLIGGSPSTGTITLAASSTSGTTFTLTSNQTSAASVPPSVTVPAGQTTVSFPISTSVVTSDTPLLITAASTGLTLTNTLVPVAVLGDLLVNPGAVTAGSSATGTIYLNENAPKGGIVVAMATNNGAASVTASVTVPAGSSTVSFPITTSAVTSNTSVTIDASYAGALVTATLTVNVAPPVISGVTAVNITMSGATITWTTDKPSDSQVSYGLTVAYGSLSALNSALVTSHSLNLTGLAPSTTYHYQVRSHDSQGRSASSGDFVFTTAGGLTGYWNFDEGSGSVAHDTSGSGYDATVSGAVWITGKINGALNFNGGAAYAVTPNIALGSTFSVSAWVNPAVLPQLGYARILETQYNGGLYLGVNSSGTKYKFIVNWGAGSTAGCGLAYGCAEGGVITAGWHLVTGAYDGTTATLYIDGAAVASDTFTAPSATNLPLYVGRYYQGGYGWNGGVDDVRLYGHGLAAAEVSTLYTSAGPPDTTPPTTPGNVSATPVSSSQVNVAWSASTDNVGVTGYKVFRNGSLAGSTTTALTYSDTGLAASTTYTYTVVAFDAAGNVSTPSTPVTAMTLTPDSTPPSVSITAPLANATVTGTISVSANATDNVAVASVQFQLDGANLGALLTAPPYTISWNTATAMNTSHTLTAIATDTSGNSATSTPITVMVSNTSTGPPTQGLIGYWNFDEGSGTVAHDTSGSGYNGTVSGAVWTTGEINGALSFNGGTAYVVTPNIALGNTFSVSAWVNAAVTKQTGYARILETQYNVGLYLGVSSSGTKYKFIVNSGAGSTGGCGLAYGCAEGGTVAIGWHLVTATYDGTTATLYVDGTVMTTDTFTAPSASTLPLYVGRYYAGGYGWSGSVDDVRLYNRALTATEVSTIYTSASSPDTNPPTTPGNVTATPVSSSQINVAWSASTDNVGVIGYKVFRNGSLAGSTTTALAYFDTGLAASTTYSYTVEAYDAAGNVSTPSPPVTATTLTADTTPPSVSITAPTANATVSGTIPVSANATDNVAVASVQFQLDGANLGALLSSAPYTISWNTATATNTNHTLTAIATDTSGNSATSTPITVTVSNTSTGPPTQGLIGYWNFDEGSGTVAHDTSGSGFNGTVNGAVWTIGEINGALSFNGGTAYVVTPNIALANTFSVSAWVNPATKLVGYARFLETQFNVGLYLGVNSSGTKYKFIVNSGSGSTGGCGLAFGCAEGGTVTAGWHLVTATYDGTTATLYVDGAVVASDTFTAPSAQNLPLYVGRYYAGGYGWNGSVDEVRLYNRALTATEVASIESFH